MKKTLLTTRPGVYEGREVLYGALTIQTRVGVSRSWLRAEDFIRFCAKTALRVREILRQHLPYIATASDKKSHRQKMEDLLPGLFGAEDAVEEMVRDWHSQGMHRRFRDASDVEDMISGRFSFALKPMIKHICEHESFDHDLPSLEHSWYGLKSWEGLMDELIAGFVAPAHMEATLSTLQSLRKNPNIRPEFQPVQDSSELMFEERFTTRFVVLAKEGDAWTPLLWIGPSDLRKQAKSNVAKRDLLTVYFALKSERDLWKNSGRQMGLTETGGTIELSSTFKIRKPNDLEQVDQVLAADPEAVQLLV